MLDGIHAENAGIPSVTICTDSFVQTSKSMAAMWGSPDYPVIFTPHPIAGLTAEQLNEDAKNILGSVVEILTGRSV